ncbi:MAG TPA: nucleotidyltransferase domain-containing protein [Polyangiaceae bacterium]
MSDRAAAGPPESVRRALVAFRALLEQRFAGRLRSVTLFGSYARGDAEAESDVDVAVVIDDLGEAERTEAVDLALTARRSVGGGPMLSPLVWSRQQWEARLGAERRIALDIASEGIPV